MCLDEKRAKVKILFIGDIVGKPGRQMLRSHLGDIRARYGIDVVVANYENASHGFGLTRKNADELFALGIDVMTGGNHSFDKKEIFELFTTHPLIRPLNYPDEAPGKGVYRMQAGFVSFAVVNVMGHYTMPMVDNPFIKTKTVVETLRKEGYRHILLDMHAEASAEKYTMLHLFKKEVSAVIGTHTHIGTDDLQIVDGCCYVTDVGLTGCWDGVIGMDKTVPMQRALTGIGGHHDIPKSCRSVLQAIIVTLDENGRCVAAQKLRIFEDGVHRLSDAIVFPSD